MQLRSALVLLFPLAAAAQERPYTDPVYTAKEKSHWAFAPPVRPKATSIDELVKAKLAEKGLKLSPEADKLTLIRRLTFDLHGLPPTPAEIDAFLEDKSENTYETLVDRLLASPHFGERQAQHWLDVVRFAESNGYEADRERPHAWRYRDYVVRSFNADKPYDRFLSEQIAGDLMAEGKTEKEAAELRIATGMHRCGPIHVVGGNNDKDELRQELMTDMVSGLSASVMGLTLACARCHDHKFDPLSQGDFYRLQAFFGAAVYKDVEFATAEERKKFQAKNAELQEKIVAIKKKIADLEAPVRAKLIAEKKAKLPEAMMAALDTESSKRTPEQVKLVNDSKILLKLLWDEVIAAIPVEEREQRAKWKAEQNKWEAFLPEPLPASWGIENDPEKKPEAHVLNRGDFRRKRSVVAPGYLQIMAVNEAPKTRLDLAKWLTSKGHPLTARVIVNRLWQHHFGRGIVNTPNDFGTRGDAPTHPELLDWLACELANPAKGEPWSLKRIHKLIVMSTAYRQASDTPMSPDAAKNDPDNKLLWKQNRRRLEAEAIRDAILTASGTLNRESYGPSVKVPLEKEIYDLIFTEDEPAGLWKVTADEKQHTRRSIYLFAKRNVRQPLLEAFDQPDTLGPCAARGVSTLAPQALILMNGPLANEQSRKMASSLLKEKLEVRIAIAYRRALGRLPRDEEAKVMRDFLKSQAELLVKEKKLSKEEAEERAFADVCRALFNVNEFVYVK